MVEPNVRLTQVTWQDASWVDLASYQELSHYVPNSSEVENVTRQGVEVENSLTMFLILPGPRSIVAVSLVPPPGT